MAPTTRSRKTTARAATDPKENTSKQKPRKRVATPHKPARTKHTFTPPTSTGKRKRIDENAVAQTPTTPEGSSNKKAKQEEKRLKLFRKHAPQTFLQKLHRAQTQRMIVVGRTRLGSAESIREEIDIVGSTGNIYKVTIGRVPECTCPDHLKGNECKHKVYALHTVLKAPEHLQYQRALLTTELDEILTGAPPIPTEIGGCEDKDGKRKPVEGECPICYMDLEGDDNELVWCRAACGNNMHKSCFQQWAASQHGKAVRCVYCRTEWEVDKNDLEGIRKAGTVDADGYINVASQFGMSGARDYSTYHQHWVRRQFGYGW